jgi:5-formyltetrahydrofolate cyclo-ligase
VDKASLRKEIKTRIVGLDSDYIYASDRLILSNIFSLPEFIAAPQVFTYLSVGREIDTKTLIEHCLKIGKQVAIPSDYADRKMYFAELDCPVSELKRGKFGIPVPHSGSRRLIPESADVVIVPALCYDESCYRLGRGGGYYDRFLSGCPAFSVGLCRETLLVRTLPRDIFDLPVRCLVTEKRIARPGPRKQTFIPDLS